MRDKTRAGQDCCVFGVAGRLGAGDVAGRLARLGAGVGDACGGLPPDMMPQPEQATIREIRQAVSSRRRCAPPWAQPPSRSRTISVLADAGPADRSFAGIRFGRGVAEVRSQPGGRRDRDGAIRVISARQACAVAAPKVAGLTSKASGSTPMIVHPSLKADRGGPAGR
jgi:hypothetical protein